MALTLDDLKKLIVHDKEHPSIDVALHDDINGNTVNRHIEKAKKHTFDADDNFIGRRKGRTQSVETALERHQEFLDDIESYKKDGFSTKRLEQSAADLEKNIRRDGKVVLRDLGELTKSHSDVVSELKTQRNKVLDKLEKHYNDEAKKIQKSAPKNPDEAFYKAEKERLNNLRENHKLVRDKVTDHFDELEKHHTKQLDKAKDLTGKIEKAAGIKAEDVMSGHSLAAVKGTEKAVEQAAEKEAGVFARMGKNFSKGRFMGKAKVGLGVIAGGGLAVSGFKDIAGRTDEEGKPVESSKFVGLLKVAGGLIGGAMLAGHGGR